MTIENRGQIEQTGDPKKNEVSWGSENVWVKSIQVWRRGQKQ